MGQAGLSPLAEIGAGLGGSKRAQGDTRLLGGSFKEVGIGQGGGRVGSSQGKQMETGIEILHTLTVAAGYSGMLAVVLPALTLPWKK